MPKKPDLAVSLRTFAEKHTRPMGVACGVCALPPELLEAVDGALRERVIRKTVIQKWLKDEHDRTFSESQIGNHSKKHLGLEPAK